MLARIQHQGFGNLAKGLVLREVPLLCGDKRRVGRLDAVLERNP
jgi:hypothetical protein